jgi:hypothetical protein
MSGDVPAAPTGALTRDDALVAASAVAATAGYDPAATEVIP